MVNTKLETIGVKPTDANNKMSWYTMGELYEEMFCIVARQYAWNAIINPEKKKDPKLPDIIFEGQLSDLKTQATPFFLSEKYGVKPENCITFNSKDYRRYKKKYPDINIYYWRGWEKCERFNRKVKKVRGVWWLPFTEVDKLVQKAPEHTYRTRHNGNDYDQSCYVLNSKDFTQLLKKIPK